MPDAKSPNKRRVLHVIPDLDIGGAERMLAQVATASSLSAVQENMVASLLPGGGPDLDHIRNAGVTVVELDCRSPVGFVSSLFKLASLIRSFKPDIVQGWMYYGDFAALAALSMSGRRGLTKLIWSIRCSDLQLDLYGPRLRMAVRACAWLSRLPDLVTANSAAGLASHIALGYRPRRTQVLLNGIDVTRFQPGEAARIAVREEFGISQDATVLIHVARVDPMKDHLGFVAAMKAMPDVRALLIGLGTEKLLTPSNVLCLGARTDLPRLYAAADFVVSTSVFGEGFSNVIAEGMACGLPAIATDVGDAKVIIGDTGGVVTARDPQAIVAAVRRLASESHSEKSSRSTLVRARVIEEFSLEQAIERFARMYSDLE